MGFEEVRYLWVDCLCWARMEGKLEEVGDLGCGGCGRFDCGLKEV